MTIFESIIRGDMPASYVHDDAQCVAFMDIRPITRGHVLVVPRQAEATLEGLTTATRQHLWELAHAIGLAQQRALGSRAQHLLINDGRAASQTVPHVHIHVIPRYGRDNLYTLGRLGWHITTLALPYRERAARRRKLDAQAASIAAALQAPLPRPESA